jgi:RecG-like helicase
MEDKFLLNIALFITAIGILFLLILSYYDKIPEKKFNEITSQDTDTQINVKGVILQKYVHNNSMTIKLKQECVMDVFLFENLNISTGANVSVTGTVQEYNGKMEIMAENIIEK